MAVLAALFFLGTLVVIGVWNPKKVPRLVRLLIIVVPTVITAWATVLPVLDSSRKIPPVAVYLPAALSLAVFLAIVLYRWAVDTFSSGPSSQLREAIRCSLEVLGSRETLTSIEFRSLVQEKACAQFSDKVWDKVIRALLAEDAMSVDGG